MPESRRPGMRGRLLLATRLLGGGQRLRPLAEPLSCVASRTSAPTAGECLQPRTVTRSTSRRNSGSVIGKAMLWHETETKPGCGHRECPIVTIAPVNGADGHALLGKNGIRITGEFTVVAVDVAFIAHVFHPHAALVGEAMGQMDGHHHLLANERQRVHFLVGHVRRQCIDGGLEIALEQPSSQARGIRVAKMKLHARVMGSTASPA